MKNLPLSMLRAFEAAGRTESFCTAAKELNLSPSAISHSIRKLEYILELKLFKRSTREIQLTREGAMLLEYIGRGFEEFRRGLDLVSTHEPTFLRLHTAPSFAAQWLLPRLSHFVAAHPQIDLRLAADTDYARFETNEFDLDIVYGKPRTEGLETIPLAVELLTPMCAPALAETIVTTDDLYRHVLIQSNLQLFQWSAWFETNNLQPPAHHSLRFDRSFMAIAAAVDGLGVAFESTLLAERELKNGKLVRPLAGREKEIRYIGHYLVYSNATQQRRTIKLFKDWLLENLGSEMSARRNGNYVMLPPAN